MFFPVRSLLTRRPFSSVLTSRTMSTTAVSWVAALQVLVVEDDSHVRLALKQALLEHVGTVVEAATGTEAISIASRETLDAIVLDLGLPDIEGESVCRAIRAFSSVPIVVLSAQHSEEQKVLLLDAGADDYMTKPFSSVELLARIRAQVRRARETTAGDTPTTLQLGVVELDLDKRIATRDGAPLRLTPTEWSLLRVLIAQRGRTLTHRQLFQSVWNRSFGDASLHLRVHITHLRRKIERDPSAPQYIVTDPGVGYRFELPASVDPSE